MAIVTSEQSNLLQQETQGQSQEKTNELTLDQSFFSDLEPLLNIPESPKIELSLGTEGSDPFALTKNFQFDTTDEMLHLNQKQNLSDPFQVQLKLLEEIAPVYSKFKNIDDAVQTLSMENPEDVHLLAYEYLKNKFISGDILERQSAAINLGILHEDGIISEPNIEIASGYYKEAMLLNHPIAEGRYLYSLAMMQQKKIAEALQSSNNSSENDSERSLVFTYYYQLLLRCYHAAQDLTTKSNAAFGLMRCFKLGIGVQTDEQQATQLHEEAGKLLLYAVKGHFYGDTQVKSLEHCLFLLEILLKDNDYSDYIKARIYFNLGQVYEQGDNRVAQDHAKAVECFKQSAQFNDLKIQFYSYYKLYLIHRNGWKDSKGNPFKNEALSKEYYKLLTNLIVVNSNSEFVKRIHESQNQDERDLIARDIFHYLLEKYQDKPVSEVHKSTDMNAELYSKMDTSTNVPFMTLQSLLMQEETKVSQEMVSKTDCDHTCFGFNQQVKRSSRLKDLAKSNKSRKNKSDLYGSDNENDPDYIDDPDYSDSDQMETNTNNNSKKKKHKNIKFSIQKTGKKRKSNYEDDSDYEPDEKPIKSNGKKSKLAK